MKIMRSFLGIINVIEVNCLLMRDICQTPEYNSQQKVAHLIFYIICISFFINFIFTVSSHTASGSIHERILNWTKLQTLEDIEKRCQAELNVLKQDFDGNIGNFDDETSEENPWNVDSLYQFQFYNCPSCYFFNSSKQEFVDHVCKSHPDSIPYLKKIKDESIRDVSGPWNSENFKIEENHMELEAFDHPNDILMVKQEVSDDNDQDFSENDPAGSKLLWKKDQSSNSETNNKDFEKWLDLIETYQIGKKHVF